VVGLKIHGLAPAATWKESGLTLTGDQATCLSAAMLCQLWLGLGEDGDAGLRL
jgi:hypothetical protein